MSSENDISLLDQSLSFPVVSVFLLCSTQLKKIGDVVKFLQFGFARVSQVVLLERRQVEAHKHAIKLFLSVCFVSHDVTPTN